MAVYEIINPSDKYHIIGERDVCCAATLILGQGLYGLDAVGVLLGSDIYNIISTVVDSDSMPVFIMGGAAEWFREKFGVELENFIDTHKPEIAKAMDSVMIGTLGERRLLEKLLAATPNETERESIINNWHEYRRSSMNDIRAWAVKYRDALRKKE